MPLAPVLPDNVTEIASVYVSIGMGADGRGVDFALEGLSAEEAIGYLTVVTDQLRQRVANRWLEESGTNDTPEDGWQIVCPHCDGLVVSDENYEESE